MTIARQEPEEKKSVTTQSLPTTKPDLDAKENSSPDNVDKLLSLLEDPLHYNEVLISRLAYFVANAKKEEITDLAAKLTPDNWMFIITRTHLELEKHYKDSNKIEQQLRVIDKGVVASSAMGGILLDFGGRDLKHQVLSKDEATKQIKGLINLISKLGPLIPEKLEELRPVAVGMLMLLLKKPDLENRDIRIALCIAFTEWGKAIPTSLRLPIVLTMLQQISYVSGDLDYLCGIMSPFFNKEFLNIVPQELLSLIVDAALMMSASGSVGLCMAVHILRSLHSLDDPIPTKEKEKIVKFLVGLEARASGNHDYEGLLKLWCQPEVKEDAETNSFKDFVKALQTELSKKTAKKESFLSIFICTQSHDTAAKKQAMLKKLNNLSLDLAEAKKQLVSLIDEYANVLKPMESLQHYWNIVEREGLSSFNAEKLDKILFHEEVKQIRFAP